MWGIQVAPALVMIVFGAATEEFSGYVVDSYCWDRPGHVGIDDSKLGTAPGTHWLHCLWAVPQCKDQGYVMLEPLNSTAADGSTYDVKYRLDGVGNELVVKMAQTEQGRGGDRPFDEHVTITGSPRKGEFFEVTKLCITPQARNPTAETFCYNITNTNLVSSAYGFACWALLYITLSMTVMSTVI